MRVRVALAGLIGVLGISGTVHADPPEPPRAEASVRGSHQPLVLENVRVEAARDGRERVVLDLTGPAQFRVVETEGDVHRLEIRGAAVDPDVASDVAGLEDGLVHGVRVSPGRGRAIVEVRSEAGVLAMPIRAGNRILWFFETDETQSSRPRSRTLAREEALTEDSAEAGVATDSPRSRPSSATSRCRSAAPAIGAGSAAVASTSTSRTPTSTTSCASSRRSAG